MQKLSVTRYRCSFVAVKYSLTQRKKETKDVIESNSPLVDEVVTLVHMKEPSGITGPYRPSVNV